MLQKYKYVLASLLVFIIYLTTASGNIESIDGTLSLEMARNLVSNGVFEPSDPKYGIGGAVVETEDGRRISSASKGLAATYVPAAWLTKKIYDWRGHKPAEFFPLESDYLLSLLTSFIGPIWGVILFLVNSIILGSILKNKNKGIAVAALGAFATNLWPLSKHSFPNFLVTLEMTLIFWVLMSKSIGSYVKFFLVGLIAAAMWWSYNLSVVLILIVIAYYLFDRYYFGRKLEKREVVLLALIAVVGLIGVYTLYDKFGGMVWLKNMLSGEGTRRDWFQAVWGMLLSPGRSITVYSPVWGLAILTALKHWRNDIWSRVLIFGTTIIIGFYAMFDIWSGELSYGPRYLAPLIILGLAVLASNWAQINKKWLIFLTVTGIYVQMVGVTVPFDTQYQGIKVGSFSEDTISSRQDQFDYWSLGEFLPAYSPVYRLKKNLIHRLILIPKYFGDKPEFEFAGGATLPIDGANISRRVGGSFWLEAKKSATFDNVKMNLLDKKVLDIELCINGSCQYSIGETFGRQIEYKFSEVVVKENDTLVFNLPIENKGQRYSLNTLSLGGDQVEMDNYHLKLEDRFFDGTKISNDPSVLYQKYYDRKSVINMTADFWWVRNLIYFEDSKGGILAWLILTVLTGGGVGYWIIRKYIDKRRKVKTYDYYHKNTFWNDHYLIREYLNKLATGDKNTDWLSYVKKNYFKDRKAVKVLSVGCGNGWQDRWLATLFDVGRLDGYDKADDLLEEASEKAPDSRFHYYKADLNKDKLGRSGRYDLILNLAALHHVENMEHVMEQIKNNLKPNGYFVSFDYIGPKRNQYGENELGIMNEMRAKMPKELVGAEDIIRPDIKMMLREDPSEAVGSELIIPSIKKYFKIIKLRNLNGGLLYQILYNRIQNFIQGDKEHDEVIRKGIRAEIDMTKKGLVKPFFAFVVAGV